MITGVGGFIGSRFAHYLKRYHPDIEVCGIDDFSSGDPRNIPDKVPYATYRLGSEFGDRTTLECFGQIDVVCHFAAMAAECLSPFTRMRTYRDNILGTAEIVNFCINTEVKRLVFTSSIAAYGDAHTYCPPFEEWMECNPKDPYGMAKLMSELDIKIANEQHGLEYNIVRPHNVIGRGQGLWTKYRNVAAIWCRALVEGRPLQVFGDGRQTRAFTPIDDILPTLHDLCMGDVKNETFNLGSNTEYEVIEIARLLCDIAGKGEIVHAPERHEVKHAYACHKKAKRMLGFWERTTLRECLTEMYEWTEETLKKYPTHPEYRYDIECPIGMPPQWL